MKRHPLPALFSLIILSLLACILPAAEASAQGITAARTHTTLDLDPQDYPLTIAHVYEGGRVNVQYSADGSYTQPAAQGLGNLLSVVVFETTVAYGTIDNETTPGTGRMALASFTSVREGDGTVTGVVVVDVVED